MLDELCDQIPPPSIEVRRRAGETSATSRGARLAKKQRAYARYRQAGPPSRNMAFTAQLMDAGVDFVAVDNPHASRLTLHILAAVAEHEREMIAERTKGRPSPPRRRVGQSYI